MFSQLANYLLGTSSDHQEEPASGVEETNTRLTSNLTDDDDWVLVDRDSEGNSEVGSLASLGDCDELCDDDPLPLLPALLTRTSSTSSLPCVAMEESWYITPPPCFTSAGPIVMETSPLENLLIEHPSMSVYHQHSQPIFVARRHATAPLQPVNDLVRGDVVAEPVQRVERRRERQVQVQRRGCVDVLRQQEIQCIQNKRAQKVQIQRACLTLKRGYLERTNKAREVNSRNQRQRRGERSQGATCSHANNNRKC